MELQLKLKKGRILYRTPSSSTKEGIYGHYYSIKKVAKAYTKSPRNIDTIYKFKTKNTLNLLDFSNEESFKFLDSKLEGNIHKAFHTNRFHSKWPLLRLRFSDCLNPCEAHQEAKEPFRRS